MWGFPLMKKLYILWTFYSVSDKIFCENPFTAGIRRGLSMQKNEIYQLRADNLGADGSFTVDE